MSVRRIGFGTSGSDASLWIINMDCTKQASRGSGLQALGLGLEDMKGSGVSLNGDCSQRT